MSKDRIDRIFSKLCGRRSFLYWMFFCNITAARDSRKYTAFTTEYHKYEFLRDPFGIPTEPCYFTLVINTALKGLDFYFAFLNDIIIFQRQKKKHLAHIKELFYCDRKASMKLRTSKCDKFTYQDT